MTRYPMKISHYVDVAFQASAKIHENLERIYEGPTANGAWQ